MRNLWLSNMELTTQGEECQKPRTEPLDKGWLNRAFERAKRDYDSLPAWLKHPVDKSNQA